jgi:hypothetical protein
VQCLAAVEDEQDPLRRVQAPVAQPGDQAPHDRGVLGGALHDAERHLGPIRGDAEGADHGVTGEVEPVHEADQPPLVVQRPGTELGQPRGGRGDEPTGHRRLRGPRRGCLDRLADRLERPFVAAAGQAGQHRRDHVVGQQVDRRERVVGLQAHLPLHAVAVGDRAHPGPAHRDAPPAEGHLAGLAPVPVGGAAPVVAALRPRDLADLGVDELAHHLQADRHRRRQQALAHLVREHRELVAHLPGQPLGQARVGQIDQPDLGHQTQAPRGRGRRVRRLSVHWWSSVSLGS